MLVSCNIVKLNFTALFYIQCRKFVGCETVRLKAEFLYNKFKGLFLVGDDACNFAKVKVLCLNLYLFYAEFYFCD